MINWWTPKFGSKELVNLKMVLDNGYVNEGPVTQALEVKIKNLMGVKHAIFSSNGTSSIFLALKAHDIGVGDFVAVPNVTFIATANAVSLTGAIPVLIDVYSDTLGIDMMDLIEKNKVYKLKAVIPVHVSGRSSLGRLDREVLKTWKICIIEDAAEAFASKNPLTGKYLGTEFDVGTFSFSPNKIITSGQGGLIVTNNDIIAKAIRQLKDQGREHRGSGGDDDHPIIGYNFKFSDLQAAVLDAQMDEIEQRRGHLINVYKLYSENIIKNQDSYLLKFDISNGEFPLWPEFRTRNVKKLLSILHQKGIAYRKFWFPLHSQKAYKSKDISSEFKTFTSDLIWLPSNFDLDEEDIKHICSILNDFIESEAK